MQLIKYEAAKQALSEARAVDEVKEIRDKAEAMRLYAKQSKDFEMANWAAEIRIRAERRLGEMLKAQKEAGLMNKGAQGNPGGKGAPIVRSHDETAQPTLTDMGISKSMSSRAQAIASVPEAEFEAVIADHREAQKELTSNTIRQLTEKPHVTHNSGENEWYTPPHIVELSREVMGSIDLDPASNPVANETIQASQYFTAYDCGLKKQWNGNVWLNPPYAQPLIQDFCSRVTDAYQNSEIKQACVLVNNATETKWGQLLLNNCLAVCFLSSRVKFLTPDGEKGAPLQGQMVVYFGYKKTEFAAKFLQLGVVLCR